MKQYCRYCAYLATGGRLFCEIKERDRTESQIKRANRCPHYLYCGVDEIGKDHVPQLRYGKRNCEERKYKA